MKLTTVYFNGVLYPARDTVMGIIAHIDLQHVLLDEDYSPVDDDTRIMDETILAYADSSDLLSLSDAKLLSLFA